MDSITRILSENKVDYYKKDIILEVNGNFLKPNYLHDGLDKVDYYQIGHLIEDQDYKRTKIIILDPDDLDYDPEYG